MFLGIGLFFCCWCCFSHLTFQLSLTHLRSLLVWIDITMPWVWVGKVFLSFLPWISTRQTCISMALSYQTAHLELLPLTFQTWCLWYGDICCCFFPWKHPLVKNHSFQVAIKNNIDVFYLSTQVPLHVLFTEDGEMDKKVFLSTWKDIPASNEQQYTINNVQHNAGIKLLW